MYRHLVALVTLFIVSLLAACSEEPAEDRAEAPAVEPAEDQAEIPAAEPTEAEDAALPAPVATELAALAQTCSDAGGTPKIDDAVKRADLNGDGRDDFVLYAGWIACENAWSIYGDREKSVSVYAGDDANGAAAAFGDWVFDAKIETTDGAPKLWLTTSGEQCGKPPAPTFAEESFCDRAVVATGAAAFEYAPVDTVRMIE